MARDAIGVIFLLFAAATTTDSPMFAFDGHLPPKDDGQIWSEPE